MHFYISLDLVRFMDVYDNQEKIAELLVCLQPGN